MSAPYLSTHGALRAAYQCEAKDVCSVSSFLAGTGSFSGSTPFDRLAEAAMIIATMRNGLSETLRDVIELYYTVDNDPVLFNHRKERLARLVSYRLSLRMVDADRWYLCDLVREWSGLARQMTDHQWSLKHGYSLRLLHRWRLGRRKTGGVLNEMDRMLAEGRGRIEPKFVARGIVVVA